MRGDKFAHHGNAFGVVEKTTLAPRCRNRSSAPRKFRFSPMTTRGNAKQQRRASAHDAGAKRADQGESAQSRRRPALRRQTVSACAVGSPLGLRRLWPRATICPFLLARTEPMGRPPSRKPFLASSRALQQGLIVHRPLCIVVVAETFGAKGGTRTPTVLPARS